MVVYSGEIFAQQHSDYFFTSQHNDQTEIKVVEENAKPVFTVQMCNTRHLNFKFLLTDAKRR